MKPSKATISSLFEKDTTYRVPVYQRGYVWDIDKQIAGFWTDVLSCYLSRVQNQNHHHYMGPIVLDERVKSPQPGEVREYNIIDGQQRITTSFLLLAACVRCADALNLKLVEQISLQSQSGAPRLTSLSKDFDCLKEILQLNLNQIKQKYYVKEPRAKKINETSIPKLIQTYVFFYNHIQIICRRLRSAEEVLEDVMENSRKYYMGDDSFLQLGQPNEDSHLFIQTFYDTLINKLEFVSIVLEAGDDPQSIFERMNDRVEPLLAVDLIKNYLFQRLDPKLIENIYETWRTLDSDLWRVKIKQGRILKQKAELFVNAYLIARTGQPKGFSNLYFDFKTYFKRQPEDVPNEVDKLIQYAHAYDRITTEKAPNDPLFYASRFGLWDMSAVTPLLLAINEASASVEEKARMYQLLYSYVVRREICELTSKNYNRFFPEVIQYLNQYGYAYQNLSQKLLESRAETFRFPNNDEFKYSWEHRPLYKIIKPKIRFILEELELADIGKFQEPISFNANKLSVEHVLPETWHEHWPINGRVTTKEEFEQFRYNSNEDLSTLAGQIALRNRVLQTIGNLVLLTQPFNSSLGNNGFNMKKSHYNDESRLRMVREIISHSNWDEAAILQRSQKLFAKAINIWVPALN